MTNVWIIGHGTDVQEYTFIPENINSLRYYIPRGYSNDFAAGLGEIAADGCLDLGEDVFTGGDVFLPGGDLNVPNHPLGMFTPEQTNQLANVIAHIGQQIIVIGDDMLMPHLTALCNDPANCVWPKHQCTGVLADARLSGADVQLIACRGGAKASNDVFPQLFRDDDDTMLIDTAHDRILRLLNNPRTRSVGIQELESMTEATKAMILSHSTQIQAIVLQYETQIDNMRRNFKGGWLDPSKNTRSGAWSNLRSYQDSLMSYSLAAFLFGTEIPRVTPADCPSTYSICRTPAWEHDFKSWFYGPCAGTRTAMRALEFADSATARAAVHLARKDPDDIDLTMATSQLTDFVDGLANCKVSQISREPQLDVHLDRISALMAQSYEVDTKRARDGLDTRRAEQGDPRIQLLIDAAQSAAQVIAVLTYWQERVASDFSTALQHLRREDLIL
ncbi:hypothetical protein ACIQWN_32305 [Streptomyces vinaceus]|uniref:hypothetical protein n=1 Tax=Streptomyces vinaceus TaxID=1960 RepID=UPI0037FE3DE7